MDAISTRSLLREIIKRGELLPAPTRKTRTQDHKEVIVGIGPDNYATIYIHDEAIKELGL